MPRFPISWIKSCKRRQHSCTAALTARRIKISIFLFFSLSSWVFSVCVGFLPHPSQSQSSRLMTLSCWEVNEWLACVGSDVYFIPYIYFWLSTPINAQTDSILCDTEFLEYKNYCQIEVKATCSVLKNFCWNTNLTQEHEEVFGWQSFSTLASGNKQLFFRIVIFSITMVEVRDKVRFNLKKPDL